MDERSRSAGRLRGYSWSWGCCPCRSCPPRPRATRRGARPRSRAAPKKPAIDKPAERPSPLRPSANRRSMNRSRRPRLPRRSPRHRTEDPREGEPTDPARGDGTVILDGRVESAMTVSVRPRVSGIIVKVDCQPGQKVRKGDLLYVIDPRSYKAELEKAEAEVRVAKARFAGQESRGRWGGKGCRSGPRPNPPRWPSSRVESKVAEASLEAAEKSLEIARLNLAVHPVAVADRWHDPGPRRAGGERRGRRQRPTWPRSSPRIPCTSISRSSRIPS